jgi:hypothetical protein
MTGKSKQGVTDYQTRIRTAWGKQVAAILETGRLLIEAKDRLPHGASGKMFEGDERLPFRTRNSALLDENRSASGDPRILGICRRRGGHFTFFRAFR